MQRLTVVEFETIKAALVLLAIANPGINEIRGSPKFRLPFHFVSFVARKACVSLKKWMFVSLVVAASTVAMGGAGWLAVLLMSGTTPQLSSLLAPAILGPLIGGWFASRTWADRQALARRAADSKENSLDSESEEKQLGSSR